MHRTVVNRRPASMRLAAGVQAHPGARRACPNGRWRLQVRLGHLIGALLLTLSGCAITTEPVPPCCYRGDYAMARLGEVKLVLADGRALSFADEFPRFSPSTGLFTAVLPFPTVTVAEITYPRAHYKLASYDANGDGLIEHPELTALYVREAAIGLGLAVIRLEVATGVPVHALVLSAADEGGLVRWVRDTKPAMQAETRRLFEDLERIGVDLRTRGSEGDPDGAGGEGGFGR